MSSSTTTVHNVIIIGSGPAGYTAALYAARAQLAPVVFEGTSFGGALMTTTEVENYPGFRDGITGPELMDQMREQALRFGADVRTEDVESVSLGGPVKSVTTADGEILQARAVILAMGAAARYLHVPGEQELLGRGVSSCATCDGFFFRDQDIAVIGGGDSAMEEATFLTRFARSVTIVHRRDEFRASKIMLDRARSNDKIRFTTNSVVIAVDGDTTVTGLRLRDTATGEESTLAVTGVFVAIGHHPRSELVRGAVQSIPSGQWEAAEALAFTRRQTLRMVILPQCIKRMTPPWMNLYAILTVATPLTSVVGVSEAMTLTGVGGAKVRTVTCGELAVLVSDVSLEEFGQAALRRNLENLDWLDKVARQHHYVIDAAARMFPLLPTRLATVYSGDADNKAADDHGGVRLGAGVALALPRHLR